jgi:hypothetical protein
VAAEVVGAGFADSAVGAGKQAQANLQLTGEDATNYVLADSVSGGTASILPPLVGASALTAVKAVSEGSARDDMKWREDAASRIVAGGIKLPPGVAPLPVTRVEN